MKLKLNVNLIWKLPLCIGLIVSCTELELADQTQPNGKYLNLNSRSFLSPKLKDSTLRAESLMTSSGTSAAAQESTALAAVTSANYALQATVSAESTFSGYSVLNIKDGSRNTTVGPSYSWANNYPGGGKLPESVFLNFTSLKQVDRIDIYTSSGYPLQNYTIQYRVSPTATWINLVVITGNTALLRSHTFTAVNLLEVQIKHGILLRSRHFVDSACMLVIRCMLGPPNAGATDV